MFVLVPISKAFLIINFFHLIWTSLIIILMFNFNWIVLKDFLNDLSFQYFIAKKVLTNLFLNNKRSWGDQGTWNFEWMEIETLDLIKSKVSIFGL
jgi:hypothetical protein